LAARNGTGEVRFEKNAATALDEFDKEGKETDGNW